MALKSETVTIRLTPEEKELIKQQAEEKDMSVSKYLYRLIFGKKEG